ncbi:MAG: DUF5615 family PIN-like protein [Thermodesulfovibrionia bacterium]|nr:DUF5615 family PIN-like protein [Thermodesulfovibrionia bacterium]
MQVNDEDVDILLKPLLGAKGYSVITPLDEKMLSKSDREQFEYAIKLGCTFLTHNRVYYENLFTEFIKENKEHSGIIIATRKNVYELARRVARLLEFYTEDSIKNKLLYI